ncbi:putative Oxidoreductase, short-chain dehydrogenase/reductase family [Actinokineospora spheciospongiae]|uniref:Putative Oxidoreductase, short-chain dehydrogenase/reductase family n=1 Tax=Actinokineospora spheciospongiae TaxID=909613 RepID=W7J8J5_9PSEU|nr:hypothetical protein [Actinokineospora spheciospongiae]EWC62344.1 putative Oxidoreductase, short-chain dehydrogenase/reductase family [Actinokineospora spheciospongiae]
MENSEGPLAGRVAVAIGVGRRAGIGFAVAANLVAAGAPVLVHSWSPHDAEQPWGADPVGDAGIVDLLGSEGPGCATSPPTSPSRGRTPG